MGIPESQLETWSHQGAITTSKDTYATIKCALDAPNTRYAGKDFKVFLQGSYCNDTNVFAESDVDTVIRLDNTYFHDKSALNPQEIAAFNTSFTPALYTYETFKTDVLAALKSSFGTDFSQGTKAVKIAKNGARRNADVVIAAEFRRYYSGGSGGIIPNPPKYVSGIYFITPDGQRIVNYPKQHSANCTIKHQLTNQWFKPTVRIVKNMRNKLVTDKVIEPGTAPSFFIEGLLYNVPAEKFGKSYGDTFLGAANWVRSLDRETLNKLVCANKEYYLIRDGLPTCWPYNNYDKFLSALAGLWNQWQ
jgi:hypothetical protein